MPSDLSDVGAASMVVAGCDGIAAAPQRLQSMQAAHPRPGGSAGRAQTITRQHRAGTQPVKILDGVSGVLRPGRLVLLMGPPGSGKSVTTRQMP